MSLASSSIKNAQEANKKITYQFLCYSIYFFVTLFVKHGYCVQVGDKLQSHGAPREMKGAKSVSTYILITWNDTNFGGWGWRLRLEERFESY